MAASPVKYTDDLDKIVNLSLGCPSGFAIIQIFFEAFFSSGERASD